ncbi:amidohydrolase family protein [Aeromicrobium sp. CTD01-1L150]|uniref:amidohydrolase family protein n=1 Tax=Aeromicrobium sp. CTD01-1L150 TaxID=3341830 RepID=UPI0035BF4B87
MSAQDFDLVIRGGRVVDPVHGLDDIADIGITGTAIADVAPTIESTGATRTIKADGQVVLPGIVDSHVHLPSVFSPSGRPDSHRRLAVAGVTTAVEFARFSQVVEEWHEASAGLTLLGLEAMPAYERTPSREQIAADIDAAERSGAVGVKLLGGHFPSTPEASALTIEQCAERGLYAAFHAGTTHHGSDLDGMQEALALADGHPMHLAHTNAYLRGATDELETENRRALDLLLEHPRVVSESHLAPLNVAFGALNDGQLTDHIAHNCLRLRGLDPTPDGLREAFETGYVFVHAPEVDEPVTGSHGFQLWRELRDPLLSFEVNRRLTAFHQACARVSSAGSLTYEGPGSFVVDAISSDGGGWRNLILDQGVLLVQFGALSWLQFAAKTSLRPAQMFGLHSKGHFTPGADADIVVVDPLHRTASVTIAAGRVIAENRRSVATGGRVITTERGRGAVAEKGIPYRTIDLHDSVYLTKGR